MLLAGIHKKSIQNPAFTGMTDFRPDADNTVSLCPLSPLCLCGKCVFLVYDRTFSHAVAGAVVIFPVFLHVLVDDALAVLFRQT